MQSLFAAASWTEFFGNLQDKLGSDQQYQLLANNYDNVVFVNTEYLSNYQLADKTGLLRDSYYAFYTQKDYGYAGHLTVEAYDYWVDHIITSLTMNYGVSGDKKQGYSNK